MTKLFAFAASDRSASYNRKLVELARVQAEKFDATVTIANYAEFDMPHYSDDAWDNGRIPEGATRFLTYLQNCDGIMVASPEYNWSMPGSLKNIIDWVSHFAPNPFAGKAALLMSATPSVRGGVVGLTQLRVPLEVLGMWVYPQIIGVGGAVDAFNPAGKLVDAKHDAFLNECLQGFVAFTKKLAA